MRRATLNPVRRKPPWPTPLLVLLLAVPGIAGCLRDPDPIELDDQAITVHAMLEVGAESVVMAITRPPRQGDRSFQYVAVSDAEVRLAAGQDVVWLVESSDVDCIDQRFGGPGPEGGGAGCYRATLPSPIRPGTVHTLEIRLPDGTVIMGETTTPEPVVIRMPAPDHRITLSCSDRDACYGAQRSTPPYIVPVGTVPTAWDPPPSVDRVSLMLRPVSVYLHERAYPGEACNLGSLGGAGGGGTTRDSIDWLIANITCSNAPVPELGTARFDSIRAELSVIGWNDHYSQYVDGLRSHGIRIEAAAHGIDGAFGVFGAVSRATRTVLLIRDPPPGPLP